VADIDPNDVDEDENIKTCPDCGGDGEVACDECGGTGDGEPCDACDSEGVVDDDTCVECEGEGSYDCEASDCGDAGKGYVVCSRCNGQGEISE